MFKAAQQQVFSNHYLRLEFHNPSLRKTVFLCKYTSTDANVQGHDKLPA
jgi:hypothetical protein